MLEELGEDLKKANFRSTLERLNRQSLQNLSILSDTCGQNDLVLQAVNQPEKQDKKQINFKPRLSHHDLSIAPKITKFYDRETELQDLANWIFSQNTPFISVLGLFGIGKSYLVKRFIDLNLDKFEVIIWKSLRYPNSFDLLIDNIFEICDQKFDSYGNHKIELILAFLRERKCLLVFDDVENLFIEGHFAGECKAQYQDYQHFFRKTIETEHQSHLILISQEKCQEMACLESELYPVKCLELSGLTNLEIFNNMGLKEEKYWFELQNLYEGNPFYLQIIGNCVRNIFGGSVREFLAENELIIIKDIESKLQLLFNRLSPREKEKLWLFRTKSYN